MDYDLDEFLEEYDDFVRNVSNADLNSFINRLKLWFHHLDVGDDSVSGHIQWLEKKSNWSSIEREVFSNNGGLVGSEVLTLPLNKHERLSTQLLILRKISSGELNLLEFIRDYYYKGKGGSVNFTLQTMVQNLFDPFSTELRRFIARIFDTEVPDEVSHDDNASIPASDRVVPLNHNSPDFMKIPELLASIEEDIRGINDTDIDIKDRALSELKAANEILRAQSARITVLKTLLFDGLKWIGVKFADHAAGLAIATLIALVSAYFGIS